ncbi:MAG: hypothetical protein EOP04_32630 [Proteobacteria bacterium]|nr:MAG: hypothetical protein EOP04_32630 [Pseudomonadota bacterium]
MKIQGLDKLTKQLAEAKKAFGQLDGEFGSVSFDPHDPASIEAALQSVEALINERTSGYQTNPFVAPFVEKMIEHYRQGILDKAAEARINTPKE